METQSRKQGIVWGSLLIFFGVMALVETYTDLTCAGRKEHPFEEQSKWK